MKQYHRGGSREGTLAGNEVHYAGYHKHSTMTSNVIFETILAPITRSFGFASHVTSANTWIPRVRGLHEGHRCKRPLSVRYSFHNHLWKYKAMVWLGLYGMEGDTVGARFGFAAIIVSSERLIRLSQGLAKRSKRGDWALHRCDGFRNSTIEKKKKA